MNRKRLLHATALPLVMGLVQGADLRSDGGVPALSYARPAAAQMASPRAPGMTNPCAPAMMNPCAPVNPCAPGMASPCAPAINPCAPAAANPCAPAMASPCAPAMMNPCAPGMPATMGKGPMARGQAAMGRMAGPGPKLQPTAWNPFDVTRTDVKEAAFGDAVDGRIPNYTRVAPFVATSALVKPEDYGYVASLGFRTVINLRTKEEGADREVEAAKAAGLKVVWVPVAGKAPEWNEVEQAAAAIDDPANYPILLLCHSANRAGAMWALYRASRGVPPGIAIQEGRAAGLKPSREARVREMLGMPPLQ